MGGGQSKKDQVIAILNEHKLLKDGVVTQKEFVAQIFQKLDNNQAHTQAGPLVVTDSHVLHALYDHLAANNRNLLPKSRVIEVVEKIYDKPEKSIEYSFRIIQGNASDKTITRRQFLDFILGCFDRGVQSALARSSANSGFKLGFKQWIVGHRPKIEAETNKVFNLHSQSEKDSWTMGDFKRWILEKHQWLIIVSIGDELYRIPLNVPCLFGVSFDQQK